MRIFRFTTLLIGALFLMGAGCQTTTELNPLEQTTNVDTLITDTPTIVEASDWSDCTQGTQIFKPQGDDQDWTAVTFYSATSIDGKTFNEPNIFLTGGGVPSVTRGADGTLVAVFQWFPQNNDTVYNDTAYNKVAVKMSTDNGASWTDPELLCLKDFPENLQAPYDPTITTTADGQYRLFFTTHELGMDEIFYYGSAISDDGIHYTYEAGERFQADDNVVDSSVTRVEDTWYMIAPLAKQNGLALDAVSDDGLTFTASTSDRDNRMYWVGNMVNANGTIRFYGSAPGGIAYSETIDGYTWSDPVITNVAGGDPGIAITETGEYLLIYVEPKTN